MRRKDREQTEEFAYGVVDACAYAALAMTNPDQTPYCVPISIVRKGKSLYFHCATEGQKILAMRHQPRVCVACVGEISLPRDAFTVDYQSAIVHGTAQEVLEREEKIEALRLLCQRYTPQNMAAFDDAIERSLHRTAVYRITIETITGKQKKKV